MPPPPLPMHTLARGRCPGIYSTWAECKDQNVPYTDQVNLRGVLGNEVLIQSWTVRNLPSDSLSVENGITKPRYPRHFDGVGDRRNQCTTLYLMQYTGCICETPLAIF